MMKKNYKFLYTLLLMIFLVSTVEVIPAMAAVENGWEVIDGNYYWYENGVKQGTEGRGKEIYDPDSDAWYWLDAVDGGKKATAKDLYQESAAGEWAENADGTGKWVRYDENGHMVKGWYTNENGTYYFDRTYGTMAKGTVTINGQNYTFDAASGILQDSASVQNGWEIIDGDWYWYENGVKQGTEGRGKEIYDPDSDAWYWLDAVDGGRKATSKDLYQESEAGEWAENADGTGKWVRYDENGHMVKGWYTNENGTYYFDLTYGTMAKGEVVIDGITYFFNEGTGILENEEETETEEEDDSSIKGWYKNEDGTYYYNPITGQMAKGEHIIDGITYTFNNETGVLESVALCGSLEDEEEEDWFFYTAPETGKYRFDFNSSNVQNNYKFYVYSSDEERIAYSLFSNDGKTVTFTAGETYKIVVLQYLGMVDYEISIGVPNETKVISGESFSGSLKYTDQEDNYTYTAPRTGIYRFDFGISDVNSHYRLKILKANNEQLVSASTMGYSGKTIELEAGETYTVQVCQERGVSDYTISIGIPNETKIIEGDEITGRLNYQDQKDIYTYTAPRTGVYRFDFGISDVNSHYRLKILKANNEQLVSASTMGYSGKTINLEEGEIYTIQVCQESGVSDYTINIGVPNEWKTIEGDEISGSLKFEDQEDCYRYTATKTGDYRFGFNISDTESAYRFIVIDSRNRQLTSSSTAGYNGKTLSLTAGETYTIKAVQERGVSDYTISISIPN